MASAESCAFSRDGQYLAYCGNDGKLKIWETATSRLKQEYTPNLHLSSPCSVIGWISVSAQSLGTTPSPWKKRRRKSVSEQGDQKEVIAMGSTNGKITLYDVASASVSSQLDNGHTSKVTALTWSESSGFFTAGDDHQIVEWNIGDGGIKCKWKSGKGKVTCLAVVLKGEALVSAERSIKWWDLSTKQLLRTFTGHANQVSFLHEISVESKTTYLISGASGDPYLSAWALEEHANNKAAAATLAMQDEASSVSVLNTVDDYTLVLATTRSGQAHLFRYKANSSSKPLKPTLSIAVASDVNQKEAVQQIPILAGKIIEDKKLLLAYGSLLNLTFEKVEPNFSDKIQCLIRTEQKKTRERKEENLTKVKATVIDGDVEYLAPGAAGATVKRNRTNSTGSQLLLKDRLENLSLNAEANASGKKQTQGANMAQLLMQGLNSRDRNILTSVLFTKHQNVIRNTIAKLPVQAITPLLKELTAMLQGKTYPSKVAVKWLHVLLSTHAAHLLSRPDIGESLSPILSLIDAKLSLLTEVSRLRGRVSLVTGQISENSRDHEKERPEETLLVYQDLDSSDDGADISDEDLGTESDENWEETLDQEDEQDEEINEREIKNIKSDDEDDVEAYENDSICS